MTTPIALNATAVPPTTVPTDAKPDAASTDKSQLSSQAFMQLLVAQLKYQDPSKPMDTAAFMNQTATLTQVQAMEKSAQANTEMLSAQRAQTASSLVGRTVSYTALDGSTVTGYVSSATINVPSPTLKIGTADIDMTKIQQVLAADPGNTTPSTAAPSTTAQPAT